MWLWIFTNSDFPLFHGSDTRFPGELESIVGSSYSGVLSSDDFTAYNAYPVTAQQKCQAHLYPTPSLQDTNQDSWLQSPRSWHKIHGPHRWF